MFRLDDPRCARLLRHNAGKVFLVFSVCIAAVANAEAYVPLNDDTVLERLPSSGTAGKGLLDRQRMRLQQNPDDLDTALLLALRYVAEGDAQSDPRYYGYAESVLTPWWNQQHPPEPVLLMRAKLRQKQHDFGAALADLDQLLARQPRNAQAWLDRSVLLRVQGRYHEAMDACLPLRQLPQSSVSSVCVANAASLSGRARESYRLLQRTLQQDPDTDSAMRLWALTIMAEISVQLGEQERAEQDFRQALALAADDNYLLAAYADFLLRRERQAAVLTLLAGKENNDTLLLLLAIAEQRLQMPAWQAHRDMLASRIEAARLRGGYAHLRAAARFALDLQQQPEQALQLARSNWSNQREPSDARILLRAALAAQDPQAALTVREWLSETGLEDAQCRLMLARFDDL